MWPDWLVFCDYGFSVSALWSPLTTPTILLGFLLAWMWLISSRLLQQSTVTAPYLGRGCPPWTWTWSSSSQPSCTRATSTPWTWGSSSRPLLCHQPGTLGCCPWPWARGSSSRPHFCMVHHSQNTSVMTIINENLFIAIPVLTLLWSSIDLRVRFIFFSYTDLLSSYMFTFFFFWHSTLFVWYQNS